MTNTLLTAGNKFPKFSLNDQDNKMHTLESQAGKWLVVYFYPQDDTPGCTVQGKSFTETKDQFAKLNVTVLGVSVDDVNSHKNFCNKFGFKIDLLADTKASLMTACGIGQSEYKGTKYWDRTTFVIDGLGTIRKVYKKVQAQGHEQALLIDLQEMIAVR